MFEKPVFMPEQKKDSVERSRRKINEMLDKHYKGGFKDGLPTDETLRHIRTTFKDHFGELKKYLPKNKRVSIQIKEGKSGRESDLWLSQWPTNRERREHLHDYGDSTSKLMVTNGTLLETIYKETPSGEVLSVSSYPISGTIVTFPKGYLHSLAGLEDTPVLTLQAHWPPLVTINEYDIEKKDGRNVLKKTGTKKITTKKINF